MTDTAALRALLLERWDTGMLTKDDFTVLLDKADALAALVAAWDAYMAHGGEGDSFTLWLEALAAARRLVGDAEASKGS